MRDKITRSRVHMRRIIHQCVTCVRHRQLSAAQLMVDQPAAGVRMSRSFQHSGISIAGPFKIRAYTGRGVPVVSNAYLCIFIGFPAKAIHLELVSDLVWEAAVKCAKYSSRNRKSECYFREIVHGIRANRSVHKFATPDNIKKTTRMT